MGKDQLHGQASESCEEGVGISGAWAGLGEVFCGGATVLK